VASATIDRRWLAVAGRELVVHRFRRGEVVLIATNSGPIYQLRRGDVVLVTCGRGTSRWARGLPSAYRRSRRLKARTAVVGARADDGGLLGWREWLYYDNVLVSPHQLTAWDRAGLRADRWSDAALVRGEAGIHAHWPPRRHSTIRRPLDAGRIVGIVAGYGRCAVGDEGWRAEHVVIQTLFAQTREQAAALKQRYPDVVVRLRAAVCPAILSNGDRVVIYDVAGMTKAAGTRS